MSAGEALLVTALGMTVVFVGLVLCIAAIEVFRRVARRVDPLSAQAHAATSSEPPVEPALPADVLAVIVAVLEVERAIYVGRYRSRLTLQRAAAAPSIPGDRA
jgi:Na+-transporting methylmalonyl-CoA/oxaloacetate decarboxylase gamma subunit